MEVPGSLMRAVMRKRAKYMYQIKISKLTPREGSYPAAEDIYVQIVDVIDMSSIVSVINRIDK